MPQIRRSNDRRRRVLYHTHVSPHTPSTPATRQATEALRAARQPAKAFGSRVHRHLRGRWFSLVPVSRLAITIVASVVLVVPALLALLHHLTFAWPSLAYHEAIARPLRIDFPDSFAAWWTTMVLAVSAGATHLIYVLRCHRRDDYRGHYQLWRLTLVVMLLASVHSTVGLVAWLGAFLDLLVGDRAVLSGANWLRIVLDVGGIVLAMRLIAEVHRCRPALIVMVAAGALIGWSEAVAWQLVTVDSLAEATLVIAAPMLGWSCFLVAATLYLRSMYRQVRSIPDAPTIRQWVAEWMAERRNQDDEFESEFFEPKPLPRPVAAKLERKAPAAVVTRQPPKVDSQENKDKQGKDDAESQPKKPGLLSRFSRRRVESEPESPTESKRQSPDSKDAEDSADEKPKRRWFGLRAAKRVDDEDESDANERSQSEKVAQKKRGFSLRLKPQTQDAATSESAKADSESESQNEDETETVKKKGWFGGLFRRGKTADESELDPEAETGKGGHTNAASPAPLSARARGPLNAAARGRPSTPSQQAPSNATDDEIIDPDEIDWNSMSKAERRRMRKKLKRSGQAA